MEWITRLIEGTQLFFVSLNQTWLQRALFAAVLIGILSSLIGVFVILRGYVFMGEAIAHSAFAGAALALVIGVDPLVVILIFGLISAISIGAVNEKKVMRDEVIIGVFFSFTMALAIFFIGLLPSYSTNVESILFGRVLLITKLNFDLLIIFTIIIVGMILLLEKEFYMITFDSELAQAMGIPVKIMDYVFLIMVALAIDVSLNAIGALLVFAFLVTPAAAAYQWTYRLEKMMALSVIIGVFSSVGGLFLSFVFDLPSGATMVMLVTTIFFVSFALSPKRKAGTLECPTCKEAFELEPHSPKESGIITEPHVHADGRIILLSDKEKIPLPSDYPLLPENEQTPDNNKKEKQRRA